jgi:hypothetical protein
MKKEFSNLKKTKSVAVDYQKKYLKCCERELQFLYGHDQFSNFIFKPKSEEEGLSFIGWGLIEGTNISSKQLR